MNFLTSLDFSKSPAELLAPLKFQIEKVLGKEVNEFVCGIDTIANTWSVEADGKIQKERDVMACFALKKIIGMKVKGVDFLTCHIYYSFANITIVLKQKDGSIIQQKL